MDESPQITANSSQKIKFIGEKHNGLWNQCEMCFICTFLFVSVNEKFEIVRFYLEKKEKENDEKKTSVVLLRI